MNGLLDRYCESVPPPLLFWYSCTIRTNDRHRLSQLPNPRLQIEQLWPFPIASQPQSQQTCSQRNDSNLRLHCPSPLSSNLHVPSVNINVHPMIDVFSAALTLSSTFHQLTPTRIVFYPHPSITSFSLKYFSLFMWRISRSGAIPVMIFACSPRLCTCSVRAMVLFGHEKNWGEMNVEGMNGFTLDSRNNVGPWSQTSQSHVPDFGRSLIRCFNQTLIRRTNKDVILLLLHF